MIFIFGKKLNQLRTEKGLTQQELADALSISKSAISMYECGSREPNFEMLETIADFFNVPMSAIFEKEEQESTPRFDNIFPVSLHKVPFLGEIACGEPIFADEERESYVMTGTDVKADFCLRCKGDSMIDARINDGDIVFIRNMPMVDNGDIAAVIINDESTLKKVFYYPDENKLILSPANTAYAPLVYIGEELNTIRILGRAIAFQSDL